MRTVPLARLALLLLLAVLPFVQSNAYWVHVFSLALISVVLAFSQQLLVGSAGIVSLGQGAFFGIGAYCAASLSVSFGSPFVLVIVAGGLVAGISSLLLIPIVRLKGSSLAVATLGFAIIVHLVMLNEDWLTGGSIGMMDIPAPILVWPVARRRDAILLRLSDCRGRRVSGARQDHAFAVRTRIDRDVAG